MADVLCFPQDRNIGKARHVAKLYLGKPKGRDREVYWSMVTSRLTLMLDKCGFSDEEISRQIEALRWAVQEQINITHHFEPRDRESDNGPGVA